MPEAIVIQPPAQPGELEGLLRSWRILDLIAETVSEIPASWLEILDLARNLLDGKSPPGVDVPDDLTALIRRGQSAFTTRLRTEVRRRVVIPATADTVVQPLRTIMDLPQISPSDRLLHELSPSLFNYRLLAGNIDGVYNVDRTPVVEEYEETVEEEVPTESPNRKKRQKVYALLDLSNSMREYHKVIFAKALMLAYLVKASEERADIYFRTFGNTVHYRSDCRTVQDFAELARRILEVTPDGSTDIKGAVSTAIGDIRQIDNLNSVNRVFEHPDTEILLISDCESYSIPHVPRGIKLHTVHLKGGRMMTAYREGFERIKAESATFHAIDTTGLHMADTTRDRWLIQEAQRHLDDRDAAPSPGGVIVRQSRDDARNLRALAEIYDRMAEGDRRHTPLTAALRLFRPKKGNRPGLDVLLRLLGPSVGAFLRALRGARGSRVHQPHHVRPMFEFRPKH